MQLKTDGEFFTCEYCGNIHFPAANEDGVRVLEPAQESCPACHVGLVHAAIGGHRIRYCERCRGMLIGMDTFADIVQDLRSRRDTTADAPHPPDWQDLNRKRSCPQCGNLMDTHLYGGPGNVVIDDCEHCALVWLDYGELQRIVRAPDHHYAIEDVAARADSE
jgi:Zn-finger nucleic acid-binding protein